jgi:hypothetical protein
VHLGRIISASIGCKLGSASGKFPLWLRDAGRMTTQLGTPRGRYDEHTSKFSLRKKPMFIVPVGKSQT